MSVPSLISLPDPPSLNSGHYLIIGIETNLGKIGSVVFANRVRPEPACTSVPAGPSLPSLLRNFYEIHTLCRQMVTASARVCVDVQAGWVFTVTI